MTRLFASVYGGLLASEDIISISTRIIRMCNVHIILIMSFERERERDRDRDRERQRQRDRDRERQRQREREREEGQEEEEKMLFVGLNVHRDHLQWIRGVGEVGIGYL